MHLVGFVIRKLTVFIYIYIVRDNLFIAREGIASTPQNILRTSDQ